MDLSNPDNLCINKTDFDWEYYLQKNPDVRKIASTLDKCYWHWITYGRYENRWVRDISGREYQVQIKPKDKFAHTKPQPQTIVCTHEPLDLSFKIAIMIHIFDVKMTKCFFSYLNSLCNTYNNNNFDIYLNIVNENNPYQGNLQDFINAQIQTINFPNVHCQYSPNHGGDIGGFLILSKLVIQSGIDYKYVIFTHSKNKKNWRIDLCKCVFSLKYENLAKINNLGLVSAKKWVYSFDPINQAEEYQKFKYHLIDLCRIYGLNTNNKWEFIAGTMFLANIKIIQYIVSHDIDTVFNMLNNVNSADINWITIIDDKGKDRRNAPNDYYYRLKYGKSLMSDYMVEHTFERIIGLICQHLELQVIKY